MPKRKKYSQRSDGRFIANAADPDGNVKQLSAASEKELSIKIKEFESKKNEVLRKRADNSFGKWKEAWLEQRAPYTSKGQMLQYEGILKRLSPLDGMDVHDIRPMDINVFLAGIAKMSPATGRPLSLSRLKKIRNTLMQIFAFLEENRIFDYNPAKAIRLPFAPTKKVGPVPSELLQPIHAVKHRLRVGVLIMLYCGIRRGELCALTWGQIDLASMAIKIDKAADWANGHGAVKPPKNGESREVYILPALAKDLAEASKGKKPGDFVVAQLDGSMLTESAWSSAWESYMHALNAYTQGKKASSSKVDIVYKFGCHQLRHSCASLMYMAGVDAKSVSAQLGHKTTDVTMDIYTEVNSEHVKRSIAKLGMFFWTPEAP